jgi:uncharacterized protein YgbK (DUF1537 family)
VQALLTGDHSCSAGDGVYRAALDALSDGRSVVLFTAASPEDRVELPVPPQVLSVRAGEILNRVVDQSGVRRIVIAGGDTSSHAGRRLGVDALTFISHLAPGAPLCRTWSHETDRQDLEIVFKGGQCGREDFLRNGTERKELT